MRFTVSGDLKPWKVSYIRDEPRKQMLSHWQVAYYGPNPVRTQTKFVCPPKGIVNVLGK
jgi:hypothetical protein